MPLLASSSFTPAFHLPSGHQQTIWPALTRKVPRITLERERLELADGDFLDLDWAKNQHPRLVILTHGLEGSSFDASIQGMARCFMENQWDVLAWNLRGCSGTLNRLPRFYHSGATEDLAAVIESILISGDYQKIALVGFSLGGNLQLKYLGDFGEQIDPRIAGAVAFSVPCDLASSVASLDHPRNRLYTRRFMKKLTAKIRAKQRVFPQVIDLAGLERVHTFREFDSRFTAPLNGFASAAEYWERSSCLPVLTKIAVPTLLVNALDDPFLAPACYPRKSAEESSHFYLECPAAGGHCGFVSSGKSNRLWSERRALEFLSGCIST